MEKLILVGGGGHCKACIDVVEQEGTYNISGIVDQPDRLHQRVLDYEIIASDNDLPDLIKEFEYFLVTVGQIKTPKKRIALYERLKRLQAKMPVIISPSAYRSKYTQIGEGTIIMHHALVSAGARVGKNCIINTGALIEHDAVIESHCHVSTHAVINGGVKVGQGTFFGSNAVSRENITIGEYCIIGSGTTVLADVPPNAFAAGASES